MGNLKEWFSANELTEFEGLPNSPQGINKKARTQQWKKRNKDGVQGGAVEYHYTSLPESVQEALGFSVTMNNSNSGPDFIVSTPSGSTFGFELKAKRMKGNAPDLMQAIKMIEQAISTIGEEPKNNDRELSNNLTQARAADALEQVPFYNITASAGFNAISEGTYAPDDYIGLSKQWLSVRGFYLSQLAFITASGDSMYPTISDGDMLLINLGAKQPKDGKIYVLRSGEQIWVKRVQGIINGIRLISDNKELYGPVDVVFNEAVDFEVIGQVVYIGHDLI